MKRCVLLPVLAVFLALSCAKEGPPLETVKKLDLRRYAGRWYEIARLPNPFEKGLVCCTADYSLSDDGSVSVINRGRPENERTRLREARGIARRPDPAAEGVLEVSFFRPFWGDYRVIALDPGYRYVLVGTIDRRYLWILSREPRMDAPVFDELVRHAAEAGFDVAGLYRTPQDCGSM